MNAVDAARINVRADRRPSPVGVTLEGSDRWLELARTIQRLAGARALDEVIDVIRESARMLTGADGVAFILRDDDCCHYVAEDAAAPLWAGQRFPISSCVSGWAMEQGRTAVIPDVFADDRVPHEAYRSTFVKSMVMVPVAGGPDEKAMAAIGAYWSERRDPSADEVAILEALAKSSAMAIANTRLLASLRASDALQRAIVEATPECIKIVAEDGRLLQMNPAGLRMIEAADEASVREACTYDLIAPQHRAQWMRMHKRVTAGEHLDWEFDIIGLGGTRRRMQTHAAPLQLPDGSAAQLAITRDITRRKGTEEALRRERDRSRAVLDNLGDGYVLVDHDFVVLEINPAGLAIEHRQADEILGKTFWEAWPGVEESEAGRLWKEAMAQREPRSLEHRYVWPSGRAAWLEVRAFPAGAGLAFFFRDVGERKGAEEALRASNGRFRAAIEATDGVLWTNDPSGRMVGEQPGWAALTGQSLEEYQGHGWSRAVHPDDAKATVEAWNEAVAERRTFVFEHRVRRHDGEWRLFAIRAIPIIDSDGEVTEWVGVHTDITEQRAAEAALREETRTLETLNRTGAALAAELDLERVVQAVTDAGVELTGAAFGAFFYNVLNGAGESYMLYTLSGVERSAFDKFPMPRATAVFHPTFVGEGVIRSDDILKDRRYGLSEPHRGMPKGHLPVRSYLAVPVISRSGEVLGGLFFGHPDPARFSDRHEQLMVGIAGQAAVALDNARLFQAVQRSNETLEQRVAEALAEKGLLADIIDGTDIFVQVVDTEYNWLAVNQAASAEFARIFGVPRPKAGDNMLGMLSHRPDDQAAVKAVWSRALGGEEFVEIEAFGDPDLDRRHYEMRFRSLVGADGQVIGAYQFVSDVTERLKEQARLQEAEAALRQAQKMEAIGQLTGGVAHDFNNLLTPIVGSLDMLQRRGVGSEREQRLIAGAVQSADRAKTLVQRLLAFARRQPLQASAVDVASLTRGMADLVASTTGPHIKVMVNAEDDLPPAQADPNQLEMAILNLAVNARDAMPEGGTLHISVEAETVGFGHRASLKPGRYLRLSVADTGSGMDEATMARAIEPFFSTKGVGKGTGLGLSMVHGLAAQLGGALAIQSRVGEGTNIEFWLPQSDAQPEPATIRPEAMQGSTRKGKALLVDDEDVVRLSTADMLTELGYEVTEAASAEEALELIDEGVLPELVVTDHLMPGMNGADLAKVIRAKLPEVPVLLVSGYAQGDEIAPDLPRLTKPFRSADLAASLAAIEN